MGVGPGDHHLAGLQRRAQRIQRLGAELRQLVQKQHAVVGKGNLARLGLQSSAGQGGHAGGMMRTAERAGAGQGAARDQPRHRMDHRGLEQLGGRQRRQDAGQALRQHRLAGPGRTTEQQVVSARGGDLERPLRLVLPAHVPQVRNLGAVEHRPGLRLGQHLCTAKVVDQPDQRARRQHPSPAGPGRFRSAGLRADETQVHRAGRDGGGQGSGDGRDRAVQRQLTDGRPAVQGVRRDHAHGRHHGEGDRQVVVAAFLGQVRRRQVHDDPLARHRQAQTGEGATHPLAAFGDRLVAETDHDHHGLAAGQLDFDIHAPGLDALKRDGDHPRDHAPSALQLL